MKTVKKNSILHNKGGKELASPEHVQIATRSEGEGGKHVFWGGPLYPHVAYTMFHHTWAENITFTFRSRERK